ncbi:hypothetical protein [Hymenobacter arizonensis]|uniref:hypothetical protein n=1 Tax=Hymenobacter arizonensis TaxID=1227077 RepID=UPI000B84316D|nr:hypothetical protein [Hymenobacter arizonensis]
MPSFAQIRKGIFWAAGVLLATAALIGIVWLELRFVPDLIGDESLSRYLLVHFIVLLVSHGLVYYGFSRRIPSTTWYHRLLRIAMGFGHAFALLPWLALLLLFVSASGSWSPMWGA